MTTQQNEQQTQKNTEVTKEFGDAKTDAVKTHVSEPQPTERRDNFSAEYIRVKNSPHYAC